MDDVKYSQAQARARKIRDESSMFIEACKKNIQKSRSLCGEAALLCEEAMILEEECIAVKSKTLAILKLSNHYQKLIDGKAAQTSSVEDDTSMLLQMIKEIRQAPLSPENPLHALRSQLLGLSYLPDA